MSASPFDALLPYFSKLLFFPSLLYFIRVLLFFDCFIHLQLNQYPTRTSTTRLEERYLLSAGTHDESVLLLQRHSSSPDGFPLVRVLSSHISLQPRAVLRIRRRLGYWNKVKGNKSKDRSERGFVCLRVGSTIVSPG